MRRYSVYLHESALRNAPRRGRNRERVMAFIFSLGDDPHRRGDYEDRDEAGHEIQVTVVGDHAVSYWADHAVCEIKVINIQPADDLR
jgi:hypothetical protein